MDVYTAAIRKFVTKDQKLLLFPSMHHAPYNCIIAYFLWLGQLRPSKNQQNLIGGQQSTASYNED